MLRRYGITAGAGDNPIGNPQPRIKERPMPVRLRKLIGAIALIALVLSWVLIAMALAQFPVLQASPVLEAGYYIIAGLGWILPAMPLIRWGFGRRTTEDRRQRTEKHQELT
jgi:hypothetical protein